ncbi:MAG: hypothetical protein ACK5H2_00235 [Beutenbergiaceae bacterium]
MDALVVAGVAFAISLVVLVVLIVRHVPESGLWPWMRDSYGSWHSREEIAQMRSESARLADPVTAADDDFEVDDILTMAEPGQAYHRPVDLRALRKLRTP